MKKQTNLPAGDRKLSLNKKTITNLNRAEMNKHVGGSVLGYGCTGAYNCGGGWSKKNTCVGHHTC